MNKLIHWNGFLKHAINEYPKESCAFLFSKKPYSEEEEWHVFTVKNIAYDPEGAWIPDKQQMLKVKTKATKLGLVKIGNVHTHPYYDEWKPYNDDKMREIIQPSEKDLHFARKFNDVVRIIICIDNKSVYDAFVHDKFGNKIDITLVEVDTK
mgnify:FL=1